MELTAKQQKIHDAVVNGVLGKDDDNKDLLIYTLKGYAGTGKTVTASRIIKTLALKGSNITIATPTASALAVLNGKIEKLAEDEDGEIDYIMERLLTTSITGSTLASLLQDPVSVIHLLGGRFELHSEESLKPLFDFMEKALKLNNPKKYITVYSKKDKVSFFLKAQSLIDDLQAKGNKLANKNNIYLKVEQAYKSPVAMMENKKFLKTDLLVIDESSMFNDEMYKFLIGFYETHMKDVRKPVILLCGDKGQLPPVEGKINDKMLEVDDDSYNFTLTDILRSDDEIAQFAYNIRTSSKLSNVKNENIIKTDYNLEQFAKNYKDELKNADMVIAYTRKDIEYLNEYIRESKGYANTPNIKVGERIIVDQNCGRKKGVQGAKYLNGSQYTVVEVGNEQDLKQLYSEINSILSTDFELKQDERNGLEDFLGALEFSLYTIIRIKDLDGNISRAIVPYNLKYGANEDNIKLETVLDFIYYTSELSFSLIKAVFGYAITIHKSQGGEWSNVMCITSAKDLWVVEKNNQYPELIYTAATRAKNDIKIYQIRK